MERRYTWRRLLGKPGQEVPTGVKVVGGGGGGGTVPVPGQHHSSAGSTDTELTTLDTHELWIPEPEPKPYATSALHQFGQEMLKLSRGLESVASSTSPSPRTFMFR